MHRVCKLSTRVRMGVIWDDMQEWMQLTRNHELRPVEQRRENCFLMCLIPAFDYCNCIITFCMMLGQGDRKDINNFLSDCPYRWPFWRLVWSLVLVSTRYITEGLDWRTLTANFRSAGQLIYFVPQERQKIGLYQHHWEFCSQTEHKMSPGKWPKPLKPSKSQCAK